MRLDLWPDLSPQELQAARVEISAGPMLPVFVIAHQDGTLTGFVEAALRFWASDCVTHLVGYIEAWFVLPDMRR
jgi:hypothetical protein